MPLVIATLSSALEQAFAEPGATAAECAQAWADAMQGYAAAIVPASTTVAAASSALAGALTAAFQAPSAIPGMVSAFTAFAASLGGGMAGYGAVPPPAPLALPAQFASPHPETHADAASAIASLIDTWMRTGSATLVAPPFTVVIWS